MPHVKHPFVFVVVACLSQVRRTFSTELSNIGEKLIPIVPCLLVRDIDISADE